MELCDGEWYGVVEGNRFPLFIHANVSPQVHQLRHSAVVVGREDAVHTPR